MGSTARAMARIGTVLAASGGLLAAAVAIWDTENHEARVGVAWVLVVAVVLGATWLDLRSTQRRRASLVVATAWLYLVALATVMFLVFGWVLSIFGLVIGLPATTVAWVARRRTAHGRSDGPLLVCAMLAGVGVIALTRPWTPQSPQWPWAAAVAFAAAAVVLADLVVWLVRRGPNLVQSPAAS